MAFSPKQRPGGEDDQDFTSVGVGTTLKGDIETSGDVVINGHFIGTIKTTSSLVVGKKATVEGTIDVTHAQIAGKVIGNITTENNLELLNTASVKGDVSVTLLRIEEGALLNGKVSMHEQQGHFTHTTTIEEDDTVEEDQN